MSRWDDDVDDWPQAHPPCRCGCGELADECAGPRPSPLGSMTVTTSEPNPYHPGASLSRGGTVDPSC